MTVEEVRKGLRRELSATISRRGYSPLAIAGIWGLAEGEVQHLLVTQFADVDVEALIGYLERLGIPVWVKTGKPSNRRGLGPA